MRLDGVGGTVAQARIHAPGPVGGAHHFTDHQADGMRQTLPAVGGIRGHGRPAAFNVLLVGFLEAGRGFHTVLAPGAAFAVAHRVQRRQYLFTELRTLLDDGVHHIRGCVFRTFQIGVMLLAVEQLVHDEFDITQGRFVLRHGIHLGFRCRLRRICSLWPWFSQAPRRPRHGAN